MFFSSHNAYQFLLSESLMSEIFSTKLKRHFCLKLDVELSVCVMEFQAVFLYAAVECVEVQYFSEVFLSTYGCFYHSSMTVFQRSICTFNSGFWHSLIWFEISVHFQNPFTLVWTKDEGEWIICKYEWRTFLLMFGIKHYRTCTVLRSAKFSYFEVFVHNGCDTNNLFYFFHLL